MGIRVIWAAAVFLMLAMTGCASSKKQSDEVENVPVADSQATEGQAKQAVQVKYDAKGVSMEWKYTDEVLIDAETEDPIDKIDELVAKAGDERARIHFQFRIRIAEDLMGLEYVLKEHAPKVTTFEILVPPDMIEHDKIIRWEIPDGVDTRLIVTGIGDGPVDLPAASFEISADTLVVRNFRFDHQEHIGALVLNVGKLFIGENMSFSHNRFEQAVEFMAKPLIVLKSFAGNGQFSQYLLKNVTFEDNGSVSLLSIDKASLGKFDRIELDHVVAKNNANMGMGLDISAVREVLVHDCELTGSKAAPLLYQILPTPQVVLKDSTVSDKVYGYRPNKENWHIDAVPLIKENLKEAEGTTYDKVP